jgi:arylsulfatase A-like enzyme
LPKLVTALVMVLLAAAGGACSPGLGGGGPDRPNVILFITDDQTAGTVSRETMPTTWRWMWHGGRTYPNFSISDPLCCPSRMTIMTGRYAHNTGVIDNLSSRISFHPDMRSTVQCYLRDAGYRTAFFGKYLNGWNFGRRPPCTDRYAITPGEQHYGLDFLTNSGVVTPSGWDDTYVTSQALDFLRTKAGDGPWFMTVAFMGPHSPYTPLPAVASAPVPPPRIGPAVGKPNPGMYPAVRRHADAREFDTRIWDGEIRMLRTVDSEIDQIRSALADRGDLDNTIAIFMSDNGLMLGEHRLVGKRLPYPESTDVPFAISAPGRFAPGSVDNRLASNVDVAPTILAAADPDVTLRYPLDGRSLFDHGWTRPLQYGESFNVRPDKHWEPPWRSIRTGGYQFIEWLSQTFPEHTVWREYYDLRTDPYELHDLLHDGTTANDPRVQRLHEKLVQAAFCSGHPSCP